MVCTHYNVHQYLHFFILNLSLNLSDKSFLQIDSYMWGGDKFKGLYLD